jgi:3-methyladenine DNA glycosylase Tag
MSMQGPAGCPWARTELYVQFHGTEGSVHVHDDRLLFEFLVLEEAQAGWGQEDDRRLSKEAGFDFHMVKPVDPAALENLLEELTAGTA